MADRTEEDILNALEDQMFGAEDVAPEPVVQQETEPQVQEETPEFVQWEQYRADPTYQDLSPAQKQNLFDEWQNYATQYLAQTGALSSEEDVKYTENYFTDIAKNENLKKPIFVAPNYAEQLAQQAQSGFEGLEAGTAGYSAALGMVDTATAAQEISEKYRRQRDRYVSPEMRKFAEDQIGFFGAAKEIVTNPFDLALPMFMQSIGSNVPAIAGAAAVGAATSAAATPAVGIPAALGTGAVLGGVTDAVVTYNQMLIDEVQARGLDPADPKAIQVVLDDPTFQEKALSYTAGRGIAIGTAELLTLGAGKYLTGAAKLAKAGVGKKIAVGAGIGAVQTVGEGVGELGAQITGPVLAGTPVRIEPKEIAAEMFVQVPGSIAIGALQTANELVKANAPATASEVTKEAVRAAAEGRYEEVLGTAQGAPTAPTSQTYYDNLPIADKARVLGLAPSAVLTQEQGAFSTLSAEDKAKVQADFDATQRPPAGPTVEEAEAAARQAFPEAPAVTPAPVAEVPAPAPVPVAEAPAPVAEAPAPTPLAAAPSFTEAPTAPLRQVAPATAAAVVEAPAPAAPAPQGPTGTQLGDVLKKNVDRINQINTKEQKETISPEEDKERKELTKANRKLNQELQKREQQKITPQTPAPFEIPQVPVTPPKAEAPVTVPAGAPQAVTPPAQPPVAPKAVTKKAPVKLKPTKRQTAQLQKLGYLPADIAGLDRVQADDIIKKQAPKAPKVEAPKEAPQAPAPAEPVAPAVAPAPVVTPTPAAPAQPAVGEAGGPVAPPATEPVPAPTEKARLDEAERKLAEKVGQVIAEADQLGIDEESVRAWLGPTPSEEKILRTRAVLRLLNLGLADVYNNLRKARNKLGAPRGRQGEMTQEGGPRIKRVVLTTREEGAGLLSDPKDMNALDVIYVNPDRLLSRLRSDLTTDPADFFVKVLEEEFLHLQHGWAAFDLFATTVPEDQVTPENFRNFFIRQSEEIENSLTLRQIQDVVGKYAGIETAGKTKEELIAEFAKKAGRRGRLAEEYLRTLIQRRMLGDITEDMVKDLTPNSVLRALGMIRNWLERFVGETIPSKIANQTPVERYYRAVTDLIYNNPMRRVREASEETNTALPGKDTLSASLDPMAIRKKFAETAYQKKLLEEVNKDFGLGQPRGAQKGPIWAKTVGKFISEFSTFKPDEIEAIVGEQVPDAIKFFNPSGKTLFSTYLYQRAYRALLEERRLQRRAGIYESARTDVAGSVERERYRPLSDEIKTAPKEEKEATEEQIAAELEGIENNAEAEADRVVAEQADEVERAYAQVTANRPEEDQTFEELMGSKTPTSELTSTGLRPDQAAARSDLSRIFDKLFETFSPVEQDVFDFLFRAKEMDPSPTRQGIMAKHQLSGSRQYDRVVESVREKTADILAENNIFSTAQISASVDPFEVAKRTGIRRVIGDLATKFKFPVSFVTSDQIPLDTLKLASATSKLQGLKIEPEPLVFNFLHMFENQIDWNKVKNREQLVSAANKLYEDQRNSPVATLTADQLDWARVEQDLKVMSDSDDEAGLVLSEYNKDPGQAGQTKVLEYLNGKRQEAVEEWNTFLMANEDNPFMRVMAWSIPFTALKQNKIGRSTVAIHPGAYSTLKLNILDSGLKPIGVEKQYKKIMADIAKEGLENVYLVSPTEEWVYIPSQTEDPKNFNANTQKLRYLSAITWCTSQGAEFSYLKQGGFWVFLQNNVGTLAIRKVSERVAEIQGPANLGVAAIPDALISKLEQFKKIRPELAGQIDDKIKAAKRMTVEQIQEFIDTPDHPTFYTVEGMANLIRQQGAMTFDQKKIILDRMSAKYKQNLDAVMQVTPQQRSSGFVDLIRTKIQTDFKLLTSLIPSQENNELVVKLFEQAKEIFVGEVATFVNSNNPGMYVERSPYSGYVFSKFLDNPNIELKDKIKFFDSLNNLHRYYPVYASPTFVGSREKALSLINEFTKNLLDYYNLKRDGSGPSLNTAEHINNVGIISALLINPVLNKQDIDSVLSNIESQFKLSDSNTSLYHIKLDDYLSIALSKVRDIGTVNQDSEPDSFFVPKKDIRKISKADRIYYFEKFVGNEAIVKSMKEQLKKFPYVYRISDLAQDVKGLGEKPIALIKDLLRVVAVHKTDPEDTSGGIGIERVGESLGLAGKELRSFVSDVIKAAATEIFGSYDREKQTMPEGVLNWIKANILPRSGGDTPSGITSFKALRKSIILGAKQNINPKLNYLLAESKTVEDKRKIEELSVFNQLYLRLLSLMTTEDQASNLDAATAAYLDAMVEAKPKTVAIDLIWQVINSETDAGDAFKRAVENNNNLADRFVNLILETQRNALDFYRTRKDSGVETRFRPEIERLDLIEKYVSRPASMYNTLGLDPENMPKNMPSVMQTAGEILFDTALREHEFGKNEEDDTDLYRILGKSIFRMGTATGHMLANTNLNFDDFRRLLIGSRFLDKNQFSNLPGRFQELYPDGPNVLFDLFEAALSNSEVGPLTGEDALRAKNYIQKTIPSYLGRMGNTEYDFAAYLNQSVNGEISSRYQKLKDNLVAVAPPQFSLALSKDRASRIEAYYDTDANRLVFVLDNIRSEDRAKQLFYHEATHGNLAYLQTTEAGKKELGRILNSVRKELMEVSEDLALETGFPSVESMMLAYNFQDDTEFLGELLARYSERLVYRAEPTWFTNLLNQLVVWFKTHFGMSMSPEDLLNWLSGRMQAAARGERLAEVEAQQQVPTLQASIAKDVLSASVDPMETRALRRVLTALPEDVAAVLRARTYFPEENKENLRKANEFVDQNSLGDDVYYAKLKLSESGMQGPVSILIRGVIGKRLQDAITVIDRKIRKEGSSPELVALRQKYTTELNDVLSEAQDILSSTGQDLQAGRVFANLFTPEAMVRVYVKPIADAQKKLLAANKEVEKLKALIKDLKEQLAAKAIIKGVGVAVPETPTSKFYEFLALFGDMEPLDNETFSDYLNRLGINYDALFAELEGPITASVDPKTNENPIPANFRNLDAREAIRRLVGIDKNFFSKLVALRVKTGNLSTGEQVAQAQQGKSRSTKSKQNRSIELQMVFDFFNTTEANKPASETPIEKDQLPVMVRLAKYAADAVTDKVLRSLGVSSKTTPKFIFDRLERQVRGYVNAQFRNTMDPTKESVEDTRTPEQKLLDLVERIELSQQIFNETKANLQARLDEDTRLRERKLEGQMPDAERTALQKAVNRTFDAGRILASSNELRQLVDFKAEARKHMTQRGASIQSLAKLVKQKLPQLNDAQVKALTDLITANYNRLVKESAESQLKNILKRSVTRATKNPKKEIDQLLELMNLGAFDNEEFYNAIADRYDLPTWDPAVAAEIRKRGNNVAKLPQGSDQRTVAALDLQAFIAKSFKDQATGFRKLGIKLDVLASVWKAGVLSGPGTQAINLAATQGNVWLELLFDAAGTTVDRMVEGKLRGNPAQYFLEIIYTFWDNLLRVAPQEAVDAFFSGYSRLRSETQRQVLPLEAYSINTNLPKGVVAKAKWSVRNVLALYRLVGRAMAATDTFNANLASEAKLRMEARFALMADPKKSAEQVDKEMKELFAANSDMISGVRDQVEREAEAGQFGVLEGLDPKSLAYKVQVRKIEAGKRRRLAQLRENEIARRSFGDELAEENLDGIKHFTQVATFNNNPTGLIGYIGDKIAEFGGRIAPAAPIASFTRTVANIVNAGLNYTPYGFFRAHGFSVGNLFLQDTKYEFKTPDAQEYYKLAAQGVVGTSLFLGLAVLMFKDIDEPWEEADFAVTGMGPTDPNRRDQLRASGWAEQSVKIKTPAGTLQFRHVDIPGLSLIFGVLGSISDAYRYGTLSEEDKVTVAIYGAMSLGNVIFEKNLLTGMKSFTDLLSLKQDPVTAMQRMARSYVGGVTNPGALKWLAETVGVNERGMIEKVDYRRLNSTVDGFLIGLTPAAVLAGSPKINRLGEVVEEYPWAATTRRLGVFPEVKPHPVLSPLTGAGLFIPGVSRLSEITVIRKGKPEQVRVDVTEETYYNYVKYNGEYLRRILTPERARVIAEQARFDKEGAQEQLEELAKRSKKYALNRIQYEVRVKGLK